MSKFDFTKALMFFMVVTAWVSSAHCSKWFGLAGNREPHALRSQLCQLVADVGNNQQVSMDLIELCLKGE